MTDINQQTIELIQLAVLVGGVVWGVYRFSQEAPYKPRVEFDVDAVFIDHVGDYLATQFTVTATNKGLRTRTFDQIFLTVRGVDKESPLQEWESREPRLLLPNKLIDKAEKKGVKYHIDSLYLHWGFVTSDDSR